MPTPITILTPALTRVRVTDASSPNASILSMLGVPKERPAIRLVLHLARCLRRCAGVRAASPIWCTVGFVVRVVRFEDGESLGLTGAGIVRALGRLDVFGDFGRGTVEGGWAAVFGVHEGWLEGGGGNRGG